MKPKLAPTLIIGPTGSGKTVLVEYLIKRENLWGDQSDQIIVMSNPAGAQAYQFLIDSPKLKKRNRVFETLDVKYLQHLVDRNHKLFPDKLITTIVILDDCLLKSEKNERCLDVLFQWTRKLKIIPVICQQQYSQCSTVWRSNITNLFCFSLRDINSKELIYQNYLNTQYNKKEALQVLNGLDPYQCVYVTFQNAGKAEIFLFTAKMLY